MAAPKRSRLRLPSLFTRAWFRARAKSYSLTMKDSGGRDIPLGTIGPKEFTTASLGWHLNTKIQIKVGDCTVWAQVGVLVTVIGSKDLPREETPPAPAA